MVQGRVRTAAHAYVQWGLERVAFNTAAATIAAPFGLEQKISGWTWTNNRIVLSQLNCVYPKGYVYGRSQGSMSIDFVLSNPWFFETIYDDACYSAGTPDCIVYTISNKKINSATVEIGICNDFGCPATDVIRKLTGAIVNSASIRSSIGEAVRTTLDISYASETSTTCNIDCAPASETIGTSSSQNVPFTFAFGSLDFPDGTPIAELQDMDITFNQGPEHLWQQGSHTAVDAYKKIFEISGKFTASYVNQIQLNKVYAQTGINAQTLVNEEPTLTLDFTNGLAGCNERTFEMLLTGIGIADHSTDIEPNEPIFENLNWQARGSTVTFTGDFANPVGLVT